MHWRVSHPSNVGRMHRFREFLYITPTLGVPARAARHYVPISGPPLS
jgi:hypothetical protein